MSPTSPLPPWINFLKFGNKQSIGKSSGACACTHNPINLSENFCTYGNSLPHIMWSYWSSIAIEPGYRASLSLGMIMAAGEEEYDAIYQLLVATCHLIGTTLLAMILLSNVHAWC